MNNHLLHFHRLLRRVALIVLPPFLVLVAFSVLATQFTELSTKSEIISLSSFIVLISFSALAFNWCRVSSPLISETVSKVVYQAGIDIFISSLIALIATSFAWLKTNPSFIPSAFYLTLFVLHWLFLAVSILLFMVSILRILDAISEAT